MVKSSDTPTFSISLYQSSYNFPEMSDVQCAPRAYQPVQQETVEVRIRANGTSVWVVGLIVGTLDCISQFTNLRYTVEYRSPSGLMVQTFPPEDIRPHQGR